MRDCSKLGYPLALRGFLYPSRSLSLSAPFLLFMTLLKNDKSYVLVVYWQKCCEGIENRGMRLFVFYTTFSSFTPKHTPEKLMYGLSFAEHTHVWRTVRWGDTHTDVSSREFRDARWRGGLKIVVYMYIILYNTYLKYVHIYYNNLYSLSVINYKYKHFFF